jgi:lysophospholipid hydrolase
LVSEIIGVVLGGGGARGLAHLGVIKALNEAGITVDFVGGTSQGAYIGALYAINPDDYASLVKNARIMADTMSSVKEKLFDLTLPIVSFFSGYRFNRGIQKALGTRRIQDLVLNFFCVSTDIRNNRQVVHTKGVAWRYVRASMSLQSYLPPLAEEGCLLVDGGYMNVVPADIMKRQMGAKTVIAVDVSQEVVLDNYEYGTHLNGWWLLWNSWNPFAKTVKASIATEYATRLDGDFVRSGFETIDSLVCLSASIQQIPSMGDISERLAWVSADRHKKKAKADSDLFLEPPVGNYGVLEYDKFDEIVELGYAYAKVRPLLAFHSSLIAAWIYFWWRLELAKA